MNRTPLISLILANLIPIIGAIFFNWNAANIVLLYWLETIVIFFYNALKIYISPNFPPSFTPSRKLSSQGKLFLLLFSIYAYGISALVHGGLLFGLFIKDLYVLPTVIIGFLSLIISHGISYQQNYIDNKEYLYATPRQLLTAPIKRIVIMHLVVIFTGFLTLLYDQHLSTLIFLIILKTIADIISHHREHAVYQTLEQSTLLED